MARMSFTGLVFFVKKIFKFVAPSVQCVHTSGTIKVLDPLFVSLNKFQKLSERAFVVSDANFAVFYACQLTVFNGCCGKGL